jgi:hypothetical protein
MLKAYLWSKSVPRVEFDQRSREARLRIERIERLFVSRIAVTHARSRRLLGLFSVRSYGGAPRERRTRGPLSDQRPSRMPSPPEIWRPKEALTLALHAQPAKA